ncbi:HAMP domain-containing sensor histidine kinase [Negadavirga shengliensis]|uniref:histidine kinase n=1 Tax=Negadavirga shengliensis TaxID=1389218 RepID=A0ABV9T5R1_9BACT
MSIQKRLTLLFTILTGGILVFFSIMVYYSASKNRLAEFYITLEKEAHTKINLLLDTQLDAETLQTIYLKNREILYEVEVAIYDWDRNLIYHDAVDIDFVKETPAMLDAISENGHIRFVQDKWQVVGILFTFEREQYLITAAAYDEYGYSKLASLKNTLLLGLITALLALFFIGKYFARKALLPVAEMTQEARKISASKLDLRIKAGNGHDEIGQLALTFNQMLERLEKSFESQKQFVYHVAHELRTPLSAIISDLEWNLESERTRRETLRSLANTLADARKMAKLSGSLLDFAKAGYDRSEVNFRNVRIDEVLLDASQQVQTSNPDFKIDVNFEADMENEEAVTVWGNAYLLTIAFSNLMENACKFSPDHKCHITISHKGSNVLLAFRDKGIGISEEELEQIFTPFYRGLNKDFASGEGIGLALVQKIVQMHQGRISVSSILNQGTVFSLELPNILQSNG